MKKLIQILFIVGPMLLLGQEGKSDKAFNYSIEWNGSQESVWTAMIDFSNFSKWDTAIVDVRCPGELKKRGICKAIVSGGEIFDVEITDFVENQTYTLRHKLSSGNMYIKRTLDPNNKTLTETVWYSGISKKTFEKYKGKEYEKIQEKRMLSLKKYIEG